ncbi:MAG: hypothetical protein ACOY5B_18155 [Spirochaetota bacterium]
MAFDRLKRIFGGSKPPKTPSDTAHPATRNPVAAPAPGKTKRRRAPRTGRRSASPYVVRPSLQKEAIEAVRKEIYKAPQRYRTDKLTLLEIAEKILQARLALPRPAQLRAHHIFFMFTRAEGRQRKGVTGACLVWKGAVRGGAPTVTTLNAQERRRMQVDARVYIIENPPKGRRRRLRTIPENLCGNPLCVNVRHVRMVPKNPLSHQGQNHPRSKFTDQVIVRMVRDYNAGMTSREVGDKYGMHWTYVEQIMRKEKRTEATEGLTIRGRFGSR